MPQQFLLLLTLLLGTVIFSISTTVHANDEAQIKNVINTVYEQFCVGNSQGAKSYNAFLKTSLFSTKPESSALFKKKRKINVPHHLINTMRS